MQLPSNFDRLSSYTRSILASSPAEPTSQSTLVRKTLGLEDHPEGGYFVQTDKSTQLVPNPFRSTPIPPNATTTLASKTRDDGTKIDDSETRSASTTIFYYLDQQRPMGMFHRNKGRTVHTLHHGRGVYVIIHADGLDSSERSNGGKPRVEVFTVGKDVSKGERLQWIVEGGKFKTSFLLPDDEDGNKSTSEAGLLISETVVPGFEFADHDFLVEDDLKSMVDADVFNELKWLVKKSS